LTARPPHVIVGKEWENRMVFHGAYEVELEICEDKEGESHGGLLSCMVAVNTFDTKTRWVEIYSAPPERCDQINVLYPTREWK
jgi:hypothetical protein